MKHENKTPDLLPFDRHRVPPKQNLFMMPLIWLICKIITVPYRLKIRKIDMKGLKPPFLVLGTHHSFMDFIVTPLALFPHRANYVSELEGFEYYGEWLYRQLGCLGTRKFVNDTALVKNIKRVMNRNGILVLYPEARYANVGTSSELPESLGKLVKYLDVPLVTLNMQGNYLQSPIWNLKARKEARLQAQIKQAMTVEEIRKSSVEDINKLIAKELAYDEYRYQFDNKIGIRFPKRAEGLEKPLYICHECGTELSLKSNGDKLVCRKCYAEWTMDEFGRLVDRNGTYLPIPDWYEWERNQVQKEIDCGSYRLNMKVRIESLPNAVNFIDLGEGRLIHSAEGFQLIFRDYGQEKVDILEVSSISLFSIHTEYDYRGKGECITLSTPDNTYFIYPLEEGFSATKIQFAVEYFHKLATDKK